ncbi:AAA family ATPase [Nitrospina gracilis]|uniref:AAA family ATPase n=1 Tax=Nitrospina gracilis TaxID=35801 RepID=UPI001F2B9846|nr:AAA family ATPase [Nitrospina gracilis]MCF8719231.1 hypothetical protein [Nitrospina gracilis Nb-211]
MFGFFKGDKEPKATPAQDEAAHQAAPQDNAENLIEPGPGPAPAPDDDLVFGSLKLVRAGQGVDEHYETRWLIENVWIEGGTGMLAGMPKTGKTWVLVDMAVSIASGQPFLETFKTRQGPVVIYSPEGPHAELNKRIKQVAARRGLDYKALPIYCLKASLLRLDERDCQENIERLVQTLAPAFMIFDPLAECFGGDENRAADIGPMVCWIDHLARETNTAACISHHMAKKDSGSMRGSGALLSFGDNYIFMERKGDRTSMSFLSRHSKSADPVALRLTDRNGNPGYEIDAQGQEELDLKNRILEFLEAQGVPVTQRKIRDACRGKTDRYKSILDELRSEGEIRKVKEKWEYIRDSERDNNSEQTNPGDEAESVGEGKDARD